MEAAAVRKSLSLLVVILSLSAILLAGCAVTPEAFKGPVVVKQAGGVGLLIAECGDRNYIIRTADYIIEGTVIKVETRWGQWLAGEDAILTYSDISIERYVKGSPFEEDSLQMITPGGTVGEITMWAEDTPVFHEGKQVRIYLVENGGELFIVCGERGVEEI